MELSDKLVIKLPNPPFKTAEGGYSYVTYEYQFSNATIEPPTTDELRFNNTMHDQVNAIWVHTTSSSCPMSPPTACRRPRSRRSSAMSEIAAAAS